MKTKHLAIVILAGSLLITAAAWWLGLFGGVTYAPPADRIAADNFESYRPAQRNPTLELPLVDDNSTDNWKDTWMNPWSGFRFRIQEDNGNHVLYRTGEAAEGEASRSFKNPAATKELFVSFDLYVRTGVLLNDEVLVKLSSGVNSNVLVAGKPPGSGEFKVGQSTDNPLASSGIPPVAGGKYRVVACYDLDHGVIALWINPDGLDYYNPTNADSSADAVLTRVNGLSNADTVRLRASRPGYYFDNVVLADGPDAEGIGLRRRLRRGIFTALLFPQARTEAW